MILTAADLVTLTIAVAVGLATVVWWFMRLTHQRVEDERKKREESIEALRKDHDAAVETMRVDNKQREDQLRKEIDGVGQAVNEHKLHVAMNYVNSERLVHALEPILRSLDSFKADMKEDMRELFHKLDDKQDKVRG